MKQNPIDLHSELVDFIKKQVPTVKVFGHPASKTSEESAKQRRKASGELVTGAKALLIKIDIQNQPAAFAVIVLPGHKKLDSKALKQQLRLRIAGAKNFRFATVEEMAEKARGISPGKMPPFAKPIFPDIDFLFIDQALLDHKRIGFNAADFEKSIIMDTQDYLKLVAHNGILPTKAEEEL